MIIYKNEKDIQAFLLPKKQQGHVTGFVPTMGALHQGHTGLIGKAKKECGMVAASIFVNPTQFNDPTDFEKYPHTLEKDIYALEVAGCDVLFLPSVKEIYPDGLGRKVNYELGYLDTVLEAIYRPGHFQGVCQVVERLLKMVQPTNLYLGQKDYQQFMVIKKLIELSAFDINIKICPTQREADGLAMSSRNMRLSETDRAKATCIYKTMLFISSQIKDYQTDLKKLKIQAEQILMEDGFKPDYVEIANANTLKLLDKWDGKTPLVILVAAFLNGVRLIDNMVI